MTVQRRSEKRLSAQAFVDEICYAKLDWPGKTVRLQRNSIDEYFQRSVSVRISIAELYHENSKLFPGKLDELGARRVDTDDLWRTFLKPRSRAMAGHAPAAVSIPPRFHELLTTAIAAESFALYYAIELRILLNGLLVTHEPLTNMLYPMKRITLEDLGRLATAFPPIGPCTDLLRVGPSLFVVANLARNDVLYGPRGYRRNLVEAGRVTEKVIQQAAMLKIEARVRLEFMDPRRRYPARSRRG